MLLECFTPIFIAIILSVQYFGSQLLFKRKHRVVPIHGHVYRKLELEVSRTMDIEVKSIYYPCSDGRKKVQDCDYVFGSSTKFQRGMTGFVKADICRQVSVR